MGQLLTSKQRARLRGLANELPVIIQVGKGGVSDNLISQIDTALEARELIKIRLHGMSMRTRGNGPGLGESNTS